MSLFPKKVEYPFKFYCFIALEMFVFPFNSLNKQILFSMFNKLFSLCTFWLIPQFSCF